MSAFGKGLRRGYILGHLIGLPIIAFAAGVASARGTIHPLVGIFIAFGCVVLMVTCWRLLAPDNGRGTQSG